MNDQKDRQNKLRKELREKFPRERGQLLPALHFVQHEFGYLPGWAMEVTSWHLGIPASEVYGAATTYTELRIEKPGNHIVRICTGLACGNYGGYDILKEITSTKVPEVTIEETACGYLCGVAPCVQIDGKWFGKTNATEILANIETEK